MVKLKRFTFILCCIIKANRDESTTVDMAKAAKEAQDLYQVKQVTHEK